MLASSDRVVVMFEGQIVGVVDRSTSRKDIGLLMAGAGSSPLTGGEASGG